MLSSCASLFKLDRFGDPSASSRCPSLIFTSLWTWTWGDRICFTRKGKTAAKGTAACSDACTTDRDWWTWRGDWCRALIYGPDDGCNAHEWWTLFWAWMRVWIWWLPDWCDTWPFGKKGECIHRKQQVYNTYFLALLPFGQRDRFAKFCPKSNKPQCWLPYFLASPQKVTKRSSAWKICLPTLSSVLKFLKLVSFGTQTLRNFDAPSSCGDPG